MQKALFAIIAILFIGIAVIAVYSLTNSTQDAETPNTVESESMENENNDSMEQSDTEVTEQDSDTPETTSYTLAEIAAHNTEADCYTAINGSVYDLTSFVGGHPGGKAILKICGIDGTTIFEAQHGGSPQQASILTTLKIGVLAQ